MTDDLPTPLSMSKTGLRLQVWCKSCHHTRDADFHHLIDIGKGETPLIRLRWRCSRCGSQLTDSAISGSHLRPKP